MLFALTTGFQELTSVEQELTCKSRVLLHATAESVRWGFVRLRSQASGTEGVGPSTGDGKTKIVKKTVGLHSAMCRVAEPAIKQWRCSFLELE